MTTKLIHEPKLNEVNKISDSGMSFVVGALYNGYGHTLGNSLRRVLLSSIKGAAITAFKIDGVTHEYTTIPGVREDIVDIMQNLKKITFKAHTDKPIELHLSKKGAGEVKASDIKANSDVEIANPDQIIATLEDNGKMEMDLVVETGVGYQSTDKSAGERLHGDMIALDAIFSPVVRVRYEVGDDRVGDDFNLQKLLLSIGANNLLWEAEKAADLSRKKLWGECADRTVPLILRIKRLSDQLRDARAKPDESLEADDDGSPADIHVIVIDQGAIASGRPRAPIEPERFEQIRPYLRYPAQAIERIGELMGFSSLLSRENALKFMYHV